MKRKLMLISAAALSLMLAMAGCSSNEGASQGTQTSAEETKAEAQSEETSVETVTRAEGETEAEEEFAADYFYSKDEISVSESIDKLSVGEAASSGDLLTVTVQIEVSGYLNGIAVAVIELKRNCVIVCYGKRYAV